MKNVHTSHLWDLYILWFLVTEANAVQILRSKQGDTSPGFSCADGTLIVRDDATHSFYCAKTLRQAECDLSFSNSLNIQCVEADKRLNNYEVLQRNGGSFCSNEEKVTVGKLLLQDYPNNLRLPVWYNGDGVAKVMESIIFTKVETNKVKFQVTEYWPGLVMKIFVQCRNETHLESPTVASDRRCVILKNVGHTPYPLEEYSFIPSTRKTIDATNPLIGANTNGKRMKGLTITPHKTFLPIVASPTSSVVIVNDTDLTVNSPTMEGNEEIIFAVLAAVGAVFVVLCICFTVICIVQMRRKREKPTDVDVEEKSAVGNDNVGMEMKEESPEHLMVVTNDIKKKAPEPAIVEINVTKKEEPETPMIIAVDEQFNDEEANIVKKKNRIFKMSKLRKTKTTNPRFQFSPIVPVQTTGISSDDDPIAMDSNEDSLGNDEGYTDDGNNNNRDYSSYMQTINDESPERTIHHEQIENTLPMESSFSDEKQRILKTIQSNDDYSSHVTDDSHIYAHVISPKSRNQRQRQRFPVKLIHNLSDNDLSNSFEDVHMEQYGFYSGSTLNSGSTKLNKTYSIEQLVDDNESENNVHNETIQGADENEADLSESIEAMFDLDETEDSERQETSPTTRSPNNFRFMRPDMFL